MKTTKITIKNLFGIRETTLDGKSVEISGPKGSGKTSVLDAIRYALTNRSDRDYIVHQGADEGEIIIETNTGLSIDRKALPAKSAGTVKVRDGSMLQTRPAEFLAQIFTPLQLDPVKFTQLSRQEKNREILNLIEFQWDMNWIKEQFGEIPQGVDYGQHILEVLNDIQAENGIYFQSRQNINRDIRNKQAFIADIAKDIPSGYDYDRWNNYPSGEKYRELERLREQNSRIERAKAFRSGYDAKLRGLEAQRDMDLAAIDSDIARERASLTGTMERLKAELKATEEKLSGMEQRRQEKADVVQSKYETAAAKLEKDMGVAADYAGREPVDTTALSQELDTAEEMRKHLNEYQRMVAMQAELEDLTEQSSEFTRKIELARELPAKILETAKIPVEGLTVENGVPLIRGLPISNLSDGELLELCVDISVSKPGQLQIILVDGAERLDTGDLTLTINGIQLLVQGLQTIVEAVLTALQTAVDTFFTWLDEQTNGRLSGLIEWIRTTLNSWIETLKLTLKNLVSSIGQILTGIVTFVSGVFTGKWRQAWEGVKDIFRGIWNTIVDLLEGGINFIIDGINAFIRGVNKAFALIGALTGRSVSIDTLPRVELPRLATGAVIPPNKEFLAVLGDQKHGTNIETPLDTMVQAFRQALSEGGYSGQSTAYLVIDEDILGKVVYRLNKSESNRVGVSLEDY